MVKEDEKEEAAAVELLLLGNWETGPLTASAVTTDSRRQHLPRGPDQFDDPEPVGVGGPDDEPAAGRLTATTSFEERTMNHGSSIDHVVEIE